MNGNRGTHDTMHLYDGQLFKISFRVSERTLWPMTCSGNKSNIRDRSHIEKCKNGFIIYLKVKMKDQQHLVKLSCSTCTIENLLCKMPRQKTSDLHFTKVKTSANSSNMGFYDTLATHLNSLGLYKQVRFYFQK